jgi:hypothetical protein
VLLPWNHPVVPGPGWLLFCMNHPAGTKVVISLNPSWVGGIGVQTGVGSGVAVGVGVPGVGVGVGVGVAVGVAVGPTPVIVIRPLV